MAFAALAVCYVTSDFSVLNVYENSNSAMPLMYRLTSVWGNHEGSMMLWVFILTLCGALVAVFGTNLPMALKANALAVQAWIAAAFHLFILVTSNPFLRIADAPFEGRDLNPVLQDPGLAFHPPLLYLGYVGFSIAFSFAIAALIEGRIDAAWARWVRPWVLGAWMCLTLGIAGGSYWAYYELGWGGFWFWDPVENASLMPWLAGTALLHSAVVMEKRGALKVWTILLAIVAFSLSLIGTFLVRSGVLTSVHAFATDPRARHFHPRHPARIHRRRAGAFCLARAAAQAGRAVRADFARRRAGVQQSVSDCGLRDRFHRYALSAGARGADRRKDFGRASVLQRDLRPAVRAAVAGDAVRAAAGLEARRPSWRGAAAACGSGACCGAVAAGFALQRGGPVLAPFGIGLAIFIMAGARDDIGERTMVLRIPLGAALRRAAGLPRSAWGTALAHFGIGVTLMGIVAVTAWGSERIAALKPGETVDVAHYRLTFEGLVNRPGPNYRDLVGHFIVVEPTAICSVSWSRAGAPSRLATWRRPKPR